MKSILKRNRVLAVIALIGLLASLVPENRPSRNASSDLSTIS